MKPGQLLAGDKISGAVRDFPYGRHNDGAIRG